MSRATAAVLLATSLLPLAPASASADAPLSEPQVYDLICFPGARWDCDTMVWQAWRESRWTPDVVNPDCDNSGTYRLRCVGLLQVTGYDENAMKDPAQNVAAAYEKWEASGMAPWGY